MMRPIGHLGGNLLGHVEQRGQVGRDDGIPAILFQLGEHAVTGDAGVVDQDVDLAAGGFGFGNHLLAVFEDGNVTSNTDEVIETGSGHLGQPGVLVVELGMVGGDHLVTSLGQLLTDGGTETTHGTGNESDTLRHDVSFLFC